MAVSDTQKVDLLYKKLFGVTKTDTAGNKGPGNESIASPFINRGDTVWVDAINIPITASDYAGISQGYQGTAAVQTTADNTTTPIGGVYPTWLTGLTDWIPPQFGSTYFVSAYAGVPGLSNPTTGATKIFDSGIGGTGEWLFDYQSGVLNFIGTTIPATLTSANTVYITGYRYVGKIGISSTNANTIYSQAVDDYQNTRISYVDTYARASFDKANSAPSNFTANSIVFANTAGYLTNSSNLQFTPANNTVITTNLRIYQNVNMGSGYLVFADGTTQSTAAGGAATDAVARFTAAAAFSQANAANNLATSAYGAANNVFPQIMPAYDQANSANVLARASFERTNTSITFIGSSYNQSNIAFTAANSANTLATAAYAKANAIAGGTFASYVYTANTVPPTSPIVGDKWYDTGTDILFEYIGDGTSNYWVDIDSPTITTANSSNITVTNAYTGYGRSAAYAIVFGGF